MSESAKTKSYRAQFDKDNAVQVKMKLYRNTDGDILAWLDSKENKQGYLKELIREDMARR